MHEVDVSVKGARYAADWAKKFELEDALVVYNGGGRPQSLGATMDRTAAALCLRRDVAGAKAVAATIEAMMASYDTQVGTCAGFPAGSPLVGYLAWQRCGGGDQLISIFGVKQSGLRSSSQPQQQCRAHTVPPQPRLNLASLCLPLSSLPLLSASRTSLP